MIFLWQEQPFGSDLDFVLMLVIACLFFGLWLMVESVKRWLKGRKL